MKKATPVSAAIPARRAAAPLIMALEPRIMFDAAVAATVDTVVDQNHDAAPAPTPAPAKTIADVQDNHGDQVSSLFLTPANPATDGRALAPSSATSGQTPAATGVEIAFVDSRVPDAQTLIAGIKPGVQVFVLDPQRDGINQITEALSKTGVVKAVHIVSHGNPGELSLGSTHLNNATLAAHAVELSAWQTNMTEQADILIYGCDVAQGSGGQQFVQTLARLTGSDVAASSDRTGAAALGGDWTLETSTGAIETGVLLTREGAAAYENRLSTVSLTGNTGWTPIMYGASKDPQGDSQAGAADTDIVGDANHGSLYTAYDDNGTASTADDFLVFRLRIDNPTSTSNFGGVAIVGMDANLDGRIDIFMSVDGRNNGQVVRLLDPGTGANISPNTTTTSPLPTGWLPNNGVYPFTSDNYAVTAVTASSDPHWNGDNDLGNTGGTDAFIS